MTRIGKLLIVSILPICFVINSVAFAATDSLYLNFGCNAQEKTNWCWAATTQAVLGYLNKGSYTQTEIVKKIKGSVINEGATAEENKRSLTAYSCQTTMAEGAVTFDVVKDCVKGWMSPIIATWMVNYPTNPYAHNVVIYGFYESGSTKNVSFANPANNATRYNSMTYAKFKENGKNNIWLYSYYYNK